MKLFDVVDQIDRTLLRFFEWLAHEVEMFTGWDNFRLAWILIACEVIYVNYDTSVNRNDSAVRFILFSTFYNLARLFDAFIMYLWIVLPYNRRRSIYSRNAAGDYGHWARGFRLSTLQCGCVLTYIGFFTKSTDNKPMTVTAIMGISFVITTYLFCCTPLPPGEKDTVTSKA